MVDEKKKTIFLDLNNFHCYVFLRTLDRTTSNKIDAVTKFVPFLSKQ